MKRILYFTFLLLFLTGCKKGEVDLVFGEQPEERMGEKLTELRSLLTSSEYGWKAKLLVEKPSAYSFYFKFDDGKSCTMISDFSNTTSSTPNTSTYRVMWAMNASLLFDTFNYITMLQEPSGSYGGTAPNGYLSDIEFEYVRSSGDSLIMTGKKYKVPLLMVKATQAESESYLAGNLTESIEKTKQFFNDNKNSYVSIDSAGHSYKVAVDLLSQDKTVSLSTITPEKTVKSVSNLFVFDLNGFELGTDSVGFLGVTFKTAVWEGNKLLMVDDKGAKYEIKNDTQPIIPLNKAIGVKYSSLLSPYLTYYPGTSAEGLTILKRFHEGLASGTTGYIFNSGYISFAWDNFNKRITLNGFSSQNGGSSGWTTTIVYNFEFDETAETYTLTKRSNASGGYTAPILDQMDNFLLNSKFKLEYHVDDGVTYGKMIGVDQPNVVITFLLR